VNNALRLETCAQDAQRRAIASRRASRPHRDNGRQAGRGSGDRPGSHAASSEKGGGITDSMAAMFGRLRDVAATHDHDLPPPVPDGAATSAARPGDGSRRASR